MSPCCRRYQCGYGDVGYTPALGPVLAYVDPGYPNVAADLDLIPPGTLPRMDANASTGCYGGV